MENRQSSDPLRIKKQGTLTTPNYLLHLDADNGLPDVKRPHSTATNWHAVASHTALSRQVLIVHGEPRARRMWRELLTTLDDIEVLEASDAHDVFNRDWTKAPDAVVVAFELPGLNGIELAREIAARQPTVEVILCGGLLGSARLMESLRAGVRYHLTGESPSDLIEAVQSALQGKSYFSSHTRKLLTDMMLEEYVFRLRSRAAASDLSSLTSRERQVLESLIRGKTTKEIACELNISTHTANTHRARILQKLNVHSVAELTRSVLLDSEQ